MCLGIVGKVLNIDSSFAVVEIMGVKTKVNIILIEQIEVGDFLLIHAGFALEKINVDEALSIEETLKQLMSDE